MTPATLETLSPYTPTTYVDFSQPAECAAFEKALADGGTVILTTHILEVAERMAERIGLLAGGRLIAEGTLEELRRPAGRAGSSLEDVFLDLVAERQAA